MRETGFLRRCIAISLGSLLIAIAVSLLPIGRAVDLDFSDRLASLVAPEADFSGVVVVDVDEPSMARLSAQIGAWPYDRDVYALVNRYLLQAGAAVIAYDILFSEARRGDDEFADTLTDKNVLAAASLPYGGAGHEANYRAQLGAAAWVHGADWPAQQWEDLTLPLEKFTSRAQIGVITLGGDEDGNLRRVPLLHRAYGEALPALSLAVLKASGVPVELNPVTRRLKVAGADLPSDERGMVQLRFPANMRLRIVPFYEVALAASGSAKYESLAASLRGKSIFIGSSSAILGDFVQTPIARMPGLYLAAALPTMLKDGLVFRPRNWALDSAIVLFILALALAAAIPRFQKLSWLQVLVFPGLIIATGAVTVLSSQFGQRVAVLLPMSVGVLAHLGAQVWRQIFLYQRNQKLQIEKLAAEESNRMKGQFLSHMTHELRTPLTAILGFNNINWKSDEIGRTQRVNNSQVIDRNGRHLLALINGLLDQAKLEAGQVRIVKQPESLKVLVDDVVTTLRPLLGDKPVKIGAKFAENTPDVVEIDSFRVRQILLNLVGNAIKFTERGTVTIQASWRDAVLSLDVVDTGPGLSPPQMARLFVAFQQAGDSVAKTHGGTGLGLTISRELATLMGGTISVSSDLGVGTRFMLRLPAEVGLATTAGPFDGSSLASQNHGQRAASSATAAQGAGLLHGTVLVADDSADLRGLTAIYLKRLGVTVLQAENGQQAVDMALSEKPHAILMDMEMPVMHGLEAVKTLRERGFIHPILAMTAHSGEPHHTLALAAGCNDVLSKPVSFAALQAALDGALSGSKSAPNELDLTYT